MACDPSPSKASGLTEAGMAEAAVKGSLGLSRPRQHGRTHWLPANRIFALLQEPETKR